MEIRNEELEKDGLISNEENTPSNSQEKTENNALLATNQPIAQPVASETTTQNHREKKVYLTSMEEMGSNKRIWTLSVDGHRTNYGSKENALEAISSLDGNFHAYVQDVDSKFKISIKRINNNANIRLFEDIEGDEKILLSSIFHARVENVNPIVGKVITKVISRKNNALGNTSETLVNTSVQQDEETKKDNSDSFWTKTKAFFIFKWKPITIILVCVISVAFGITSLVLATTL